MNIRTIALATVLSLFATASFATDATYCKKLSDLYRLYARAGQVQSDAADAMDKCTAGNTAVGIPVLEKLLTGDKVKLPARD